MKKTFLKALAGIAAVAFAVSCTAPAPKYKMVIVDAPFAMEPIKECCLLYTSPSPRDCS